MPHVSAAAPSFGRDTSKPRPPLVQDSLVFDIETGPLSWRKVEHIVGPFDGSTIDYSHLPGYFDFDESAVKTGNLKPENAQAKIAAAREEHARDRAGLKKAMAAHLASEQAAYRDRIMEKAALNATRGRVLVVGIFDTSTDEFSIVHNDKSESKLLQETWELLAACAGRVIGFNSNSFDLPFMFRRSVILGVKVPDSLFKIVERWRFWDERFIDLLRVWQAGNNQEYITLDELARALGVGCKTGDGADFAQKWVSDREGAIEYLRNDVAELTLGVAERILL